MDFKLYTTALKAYTADNGDLYVRGTTSSTIRDLHGDEMTLNALHTMRDTAKNNMTIWLNHNYNVPDDIFGSVADAFIEKRMDPETGLDVYDLDLAIRVVGEDENPLAMKAYRAIKRGVKLGLSIGARVEKVSKRKDANDQDTYVIDSVRLLESSIVGIPANQRSYLQNALKSVRGGAGNLPDIEELLLDTKAADKFKVGDMVTWGASGGDATGKITDIVREGKLEVPDSSFTISAEEGDPAVLIRVYRDGKPTDRLVGHKMSTLKVAKSFEDFDVKAVEVEGKPSADKAPLIGSLYNLLSETTAFYLKAHGAHWNVTGENFQQYHELFESIYEDVHASLDPLAENLRKLNSPAPFEIRDLANMSTYTSTTDSYEAEDLAKDLYAANESLLEVIGVGIKAALDLNQQGIANFLAERQNMHQKWSWQLRSSLAPEAPEAEAPESAVAAKAAGVVFGGYVSWKAVDGENGVGEVEQVLEEGEITVPKTGEKIAAKPGDPAVMVRVWLPVGGGSYKSTSDFMGFNASQLTAIPEPGKARGGKKKPDATTVPGLEIVHPVKEETKSMEDLEQKKTRVTVTVSTDAEANNEAAAAVAPSAPAAAALPEEVEAAAPEAEVEPVVEEPAVEPAVAEPVVEEPAAEEPVAQEHPAAAPEVVLASADEVIEKAGASVVERLAIVVKELKSIADQYAKDKNPKADAVLEVVDALNEVLGGEESAPASEMPTKSADSIEITAPEGNALVELESLAKSALDAAISAQQEVAAIRREFTELSGEKAKVESELAKALDVVGRLMNLPGGRKEIETTGTKGATAVSAPWLSPYIQRVLDTEEK